MRLVDADALKANCDIKLGNDTIGRRQYVMFHEIDDAPTIDAVEVVRCGECKHMMADGRCKEFADDEVRPSATDFCSYGKRREDKEV